MEWNSLKASDKSRIIRTAVEHGITDLEEIKSFWNDNIDGNQYDDGGIFTPEDTQSQDNPPMGRANPDNWKEYMDWAYAASERLSREWDEPESFIFFDMLNNNDYDYKAFYDEDPERAWQWLASPEGSHFDDVGKTVYHPSFSNESMYSANNYGDMGTGANPENITGPSWNDNNQLIDSQGNVVFDENQYPLGGNMFIGTKETQETSPWEPPKSRKVVSYRTDPEKYMEMAKKTLNTFGVSDETIQSDPAIKDVMTKYVLSSTFKDIQKPEARIEETVWDSAWTPSPDILNYIKQKEGFRNKSYVDANGVPTIGYGFTGNTYNKYKAGITREQADKEFINITNRFAKMFADATPNWEYLNPNMRDALFSYYYNIGHGNYTNNSKLLQKALREKNWEEVARQMDFGYNDTKNPGLRIRRQEEQKRFLTPWE